MTHTTPWDWGLGIRNCESRIPNPQSHTSRIHWSQGLVPMSGLRLIAVDWVRGWPLMTWRVLIPLVKWSEAARWPCNHVAMWLYGYVVMWLCGQFETKARSFHFSKSNKTVVQIPRTTIVHTFQTVRFSHFQHAFPNLSRSYVLRLASIFKCCF